MSMYGNEVGAVTRLPGNSLGLFETSASTMANIAPALSVFLTIPFLVAEMGTMAPWIFILAAVAILCTGVAVIEFTKRLPSAGGFISYITNGAASGGKTSGTVMGSVAFYLLLFAYPVSISSLASFFGYWLQTYLNWNPNTWIYIAVASILLAIPFLLKGTGVSVKLAFALFALEAAVLVIFSIIIFIKNPSAMNAPFHSVSGLGFKGMAGLSFSFAFFGYVGWENSAPLAEEARDPGRTIPRTIIISVGVCMVVFFLAAYALVVGFVGWQGADHGIHSLATYAYAAPYLTLSAHFTPYLHALMFLVGLSSALGGILAASLPATRYFYHGARAGLLPKSVAKVSPKTGVPHVAMWVYVVSVLTVTIVLDLILHNGVTISGDESGISTVPLLIVYVLTSLFLPFFITKRDPQNFNVLRHVIIPYFGMIVVGYGIWSTIKPGQAFPANTYVWYVLAYVVVALVGAVYGISRRSASYEQLASGLND